MHFTLLKYILAIQIWVLLSCNNQSDISKVDLKSDSTEIQSKPKSATIQYFKNPDATYGFDIYLDGQRTIHQPYVPAIQNKIGFADTVKAALVANLMVKKIYSGNGLPTVSLHELDSLKIIESTHTK